MTATVRARVSHGGIELLEKIDFPEGREVLVTINEIMNPEKEAVDLNDDDVWENDTFFKLAGIMDSGLGDLAKNHDKYLYGQPDK
ncbi:antitoxin AF2212-like protein [Candidatus Magnetomonas plexicatena]|uniref:antitoxin AF2212-like protein n=1 Tax=Candidatus Magnetomonas plexicatena TaxID=2552947 RepID=UPI001C741C9F|nr:antitoxin family protein [Nitrospirales bacterium LBB_01]